MELLNCNTTSVSAFVFGFGIGILVLWLAATVRWLAMWWFGGPRTQREADFNL